MIDAGPWSPLQKLATAMAAGVITLDGLDIQILSFAVPQIARDWHLAKSSFALVFATSLLAVAAGTAVGGWLGDTIGRRKSILLAVTWFGMFTVLLASSHSLTGLFIYRLTSGLGIGAVLPNATAYIAEITPARVRTAVLSSTIVCIPFGGFIGGVVAANVLPIAGWRTLILVSGVLPIVLACVLFFALPESPRFLAANPSQQDQLPALLSRFGFRTEPGATIFAEVKTSAEAHSRDGIGVLLSPPFRRDTLSLWSAFCFCLISVYMVFNWLPSILSNAGLGPAAASTGLATYNLCGIVGSILLGIWMNRSGSRIPLLVAGVASVASALWLVLHLRGKAMGGGLLGFQIGAHGFFVNGVQTALYALAAHLYPTRLRARGVAAAAAVGRTGAVLSAFLGGRALNYNGAFYFFILAVTLAATLVSLLFLRDHIPGSRKVAALQRGTRYEGR